MSAWFSRESYGLHEIKQLREITPERSQFDNSWRYWELSFLYTTCLLNALYILVKHHENILKGLEIWPAQVLTTKGNNSRMSELSFLYETRLLSVL